MQTGPYIRLAVDLNRMDRYFPLDYDIHGGFEYEMVIPGERYQEMASLLESYGVGDEQTVQEICFIGIWLEKELQLGSSKNNPDGKFNRMWAELDGLNEYLLKNRVTGITFTGEIEREQPGEEFELDEEINIDRVCDALRSAFREEFGYENENRRSRGLTAWRRRKLVRIKNYFLNYFASVPALDCLELEVQNELISSIIPISEHP